MTKRAENDRLQDQIDQNLRKVYQQELDREVPDRFRELLAQLKEQDAQHDS